ncbi:glycosyltransferase [Botrimarina hoheduenensis]|nr:glycosyltransferase [Botrimarina hoheduenensis]
MSTAVGWGGGERLLAQLIEGFCEVGAEPLLAVPAASELATWAQQQDVPTALLPGRGRGLAACLQIRRRFASAGLQAVILNDPHAITYGGVALTGLSVPRLGIRHTCYPVRSAWKHNRLVDHVVCVSAAAERECLIAGVDQRRLSVLYSGVKPAVVAPRAVEVARSAFLPDDGAKRVLAIGNLQAVKGYDTLLRATAEAYRQGDCWRVAIAGEGPERPHLEALAQELGIADRVQLLGFRADAAALLRSADVFVNASHSEGLSLVLIEAMQAGTPIVSTLVGGCREVLGATGSDVSPVASVFEPGDATGLAAAVERQLGDPEMLRERLAAGSQRAAEQFSVEGMIRGYAELIDHLTTTDRRVAA